jgi:dephospho-CoA kinase
MIKVGLTGGIGTGKSVVAKIFENIGVPVFHADEEARSILGGQGVIREISGCFGNAITDASGQIDRKELAKLVFSDPQKLEILNGIIHPLVAKAFNTFCLKQQDKRYIVHEAAILYESGFDKYIDKIIVVTAPYEVCIERVMNRDRVNREEVLLRMKNQWDSNRKATLADYLVQNDGNSPVLPQVLRLNRIFDELAG